MSSLSLPEGTSRGASTASRAALVMSVFVLILCAPLGPGLDLHRGLRRIGHGFLCRRRGRLRESECAKSLGPGEQGALFVLVLLHRLRCIARAILLERGSGRQIG